MQSGTEMNPVRSYSDTDCAVVAIQALINRSRGDIAFASGYRKGIGVTCNKIVPILCVLTGNYWMRLYPVAPLFPKVGDLANNFRGIIVVDTDHPLVSHAAAVEGYQIHDNLYGKRTIFDPIWRERVIKSLIVEEER